MRENHAFFVALPRKFTLSVCATSRANFKPLLRIIHHWVVQIADISPIPSSVLYLGINRPNSITQPWAVLCLSALGRPRYVSVVPQKWSKRARYTKKERKKKEALHLWRGNWRNLRFLSDAAKLGERKKKKMNRKKEMKKKRGATEVDRLIRLAATALHGVLGRILRSSTF